MKASEFLYQTQKVIPVEGRRLQKQAVGLRKAGFYADGREAEERGHVKAIQAAHLIRCMALNLNPDGKDFDDKIKEYQQLLNDKDFFINDLASILSEDGWRMDKEAGEHDGKTLIDRLHRISFSQDRPFVTIVRRRFEYWGEDGQMMESENFTEFETVYGKDLKALTFERFAIVKREVIKDLAEKLSRTGLDTTIRAKTEADLKLREEILKHINS